MYSTRITPVCPETLIKARNTAPDEALNCVPINKSASNPNRRHRDVGQPREIRGFLRSLRITVQPRLRLCVVTSTTACFILPMQSK